MAQDNPKTGRNSPAFTAYFIPDRDGCPWVPIGAAWAHQDAEGFTLKLDLIPATDGRILLRKVKAQVDGGEQ